MRRPCAWAFQKDSELLSIMNYHLVKLRETGILEELARRFIHNCNSTKNILDASDQYKDEDVGLGYEHFKFPFLALLTGLCIAILQAGFESMVLCKRKCMQDEEKLKEDELTSEDEKDQAEVWDIQHPTLTGAEQPGVIPGGGGSQNEETRREM